MLNERLIGETVKIVIDFFESQGITETTAAIRKRAVNWYTHSEIVTPQRLAAVVISGDYRPITWNEVLEIENFYFPDVPVEYGFSIGEFEGSMEDEMWR